MKEECAKDSLIDMTHAMSSIKDIIMKTMNSIEYSMESMDSMNEVMKKFKKESDEHYYMRQAMRYMKEAQIKANASIESMIEAMRYMKESIKKDNASNESIT